MKTVLVQDRQSMGQFVADAAADVLRKAIADRGNARLIVATGASQFEVLQQLVTRDLDWSVVDAFHLDEYIGIDADHPASFCGYLKQRFVDHVPLRSFAYLPGDQDPAEVMSNVGRQLQSAPVDLALVGIGENGHLAFNDPPADFDTDAPYIRVALDEACRRQQVGEGWFAGLDDVPTHAISMSIRQIMKTSTILCSVPDAQKADAVRRTLLDEISPEIPASILRRHDDATLIIDRASAAKLPPEVLQDLEFTA
ncbi:glucosamine-6-phosphate deaminase [Crateriforma conspicua]|uniref:Glucosamine-6-phosphate deaminase 1 n=1 Tax=Crateriforma conspicua TaxID=2527996 RepID=A0A5C6G2X3_9PLAN|nr:Glucosamine-6-phosphate deaminase 1 [Crateriforma conspicua]